MHPALANDPTARARFGREASAAAAVAHPGVVSVYQVGQLARSGTAYFVMQYVDGISLMDDMVPGQAIPEPRARRIVGEVASALAAAHARGVVHRDIKPANIMTEQGGRVVVLDFGISAALEHRLVPGVDRLTAEGHSIGTPMYMSPEQAAAAEITGKSDVYSLGVVAFELTTGRPPFAGTPMELLAAHLKDPPPKVASLRPDIGAEFAQLIDACLQKHPEDRPAAADVARALLPSVQPIIEWPPPGLDSLRETGARLATSLNLTAAGAFGFMALQLWQPIMLSPTRLNDWLQEHGPTDPTRDFDGVPLWFFVLTLLSVAALGLVPIVLSRAWTLARQLSWARRSGYPWRVLLDVAWDASSDTGALINGSGRFAIMEASLREHLLRLRRVSSAVESALPLLAALSLVTWVIGWTGGRAAAGVVLPAREAALLFGPAILWLFTIAWLRRIEVRWGSSARAPSRPHWRKQPALRPELLDAWLMSAGRRGAVDKRGAFLSLTSYLAVMILLALIVAGTVVFLALFASARNVALSKEHALRLLASLTTDSLRPTPWPAYDSLVALSARIPDQGAVVDTQAAQRLIGWTRFQRGEIAYFPAYLNADTTGRPEQGLSGSNYEFLRFIGSNPSPVSTADIPKLAEDTLTPLLNLWRRIARSAPLPPLWHSRPDLPTLESPLSFSGLGRSRHTALHNVSASLVALAERDSATALLRARENISVARQMARSEVFFEHLVGLVDIRFASQLIDRTGDVMNDSALKDEAERLRVLVLRAKTDLLPWWRGGAAVLMSDPSNPVLASYASVSTLSPAARTLLAHAAVTGFCFNAREIIFGPSPRRRDVLSGIARALRRVPRMDDVILAERRELDEWISAPSRMNQRYLDVLAGLGMWQGPMTRTLAPLGWVGLAGLRDRLLFCLTTARSQGNWVQ
jgi:hypothetical protein